MAAEVAALLPFALDQEGPAPPELCASSGFVVALCFAIPGRRASPADFTVAVAAALFMSFALEQEGSASPEDTSVMELYCATPRGRASPTGSSTALVAASVVSLPPGQEDPASPEDTASSTTIFGTSTNCSAAQKTRRTAPQGGCALLSPASPDAGRKPHRQSPSPSRARPGRSTHQPTSRAGWAHCARAGTVGASTHFQSDKRSSQRHLDWSPQDQPITK